MSEGLEDRDALILEFLGLADGLARRFCRMWVGLVEPEEIQQEARLELVRAVDALDRRPSAGPYIQKRINGALAHWLRDRSRLVRVPRQHQEGKWVEVRHDSLDRPVGHDGETTFLDLLAQPEAPAEPVSTGELDDLLDQLPAHEAATVRLSLMEGRSLADVARDMGISRQAASRRVGLAVKRLRAQLEVVMES
jgi:RNA polymerase sigma-B factor